MVLEPDTGGVPTRRLRLGPKRRTLNGIRARHWRCANEEAEARPQKEDTKGVDWGVPHPKKRTRRGWIGGPALIREENEC